MNLVKKESVGYRKLHTCVFKQKAVRQYNEIEDCVYDNKTKKIL